MGDLMGVLGCSGGLAARSRTDFKEVASTIDAMGYVMSLSERSLSQHRGWWVFWIF
jgi:hypothetical protein